MGTTLFTFLADEMHAEADKIENSRNSKLEKENISKDDAKTMTKSTQKEHTEKKASDSNKHHTLMNDSKTRNKNDKSCFENISVDCRGILFGRI